MPETAHLSDFNERPDDLLAVQPRGRREDEGLQSVGHPTNLLERARPGKRILPRALRTPAVFWQPTGTCGATQINRRARELLASDDIISMIPASQESIDQLKFSECLPEELAHRAVLGRLDLAGLTVEQLIVK